MSFYDNLAEEYDQITGLSDKAEAIQTFADRVIESYKPRTVLDAACGTGAYALAFARRGVEVTASDISAGLIEQGQRKAEAENLQIRWVESSFDQLPAAHIGPFDLICCMGNSLAHLLSLGTMRASLTGFSDVLAPQGRLITTTLNYQPILETGERILSVDRAGQREYVRFYDFLTKELIAFNILRIDWADTPPATRLHTTQLRPWSPDEFQVHLAQAGLVDIEIHEGIGFGPFKHRTSDVLLLTARKSE